MTASLIVGERGLNKRPWIALALAPIPGLAQICLGRTKKGLALFCMGAAAAATAYFSDSPIFILLGIFLYLATALPAAVEAYFLARSGQESGLLDSRRYVVAMLLTTGFSALPLLWQNPRFTKKEKIVWSAAVPALAAIFFGLIAFWGPDIERYLRRS